MHRSFYILVLIAVLGFEAGAAHAQQPGAFARMGFGARGLAMGNGLVADVSGAASPYYNPALAPHVSHTNIQTAYGLLSHDRALQYLQYATPLDERAGLSFGFIHAGVSDIDGRDESGYHTQTYSTNEYALLVSFGIKMNERVSGGMGLRVYRASYLPSIEPATGLGLNVGVAVRVTERLYLALAAGDLLARYSWDTSPLYGNQGRQTTDRFPVRLRLGASYQMMDNTARVLVEYESRLLYVDEVIQAVEVVGGRAVQTTATRTSNRYRSGVRIGGEWFVVEPFAVRAGVSRLQPWASGTIVPSVGFSIREDLAGVTGQLDYTAVVEPYLMGMRHVLGLRVDL